VRLRFFPAILLASLPVPAKAVCVGFGVTATALGFGVYQPSAASPTTSQGTVTVQCGIGLLGAFSVALSKGTGSFAQRTMKMSSNSLNYNLYTDLAHSMVWGDGTGGTFTQSFSALISLGSINYTVYGQIPSGQYPAPGPYNDTITATVTF
jgi:spore coat protein U-like protein